MVNGRKRNAVQGVLLTYSGVELLGRNISVDDLAARSGAIGYEILTGLGRRYNRVYVGA